MDDSHSLLQMVNLDIEIGNIQVCHNLNWTVNSNEVWGILGLNGVGKTTLFNTISGLHEASSGQVLIQNTALAQWPHKALAKELGYLFQSLSHEFPQTVDEFCTDALYPYINQWQNMSADQLQIISDSLSVTEMTDKRERLINSLSGGEKRRTEIAGLLVQNPRLWLLDEPVNHLDLRHQIHMMQVLIEAAQKRSGSIICIFHDPNLAKRFCTHILLLKGNGSYENGITEKILTAEKLSQLYQQTVIELHDNDKAAFIAD
ncbi:MAG: ABC transporter ATP-binding protein [Gammaproteobacteria bacterium]|nr:ABC transporter ATP-binding protein [Gammaproteobacteria bacterium]